MRFWPREQLQAAGKFIEVGALAQVSGASGLESNCRQQGSLDVGGLVQVSGASGFESVIGGSRDV